MRLRPLELFRQLELRKVSQLIVYLPSFGRLFWRLAKDPRVPIAPKMLLLLVLVYIITPLDLIPDFVPALGQVDDLMALVLGLRLFLRLCPEPVVRQHVQAIAAGR